MSEDRRRRETKRVGRQLERVACGHVGEHLALSQSESARIIDLGLVLARDHVASSVMVEVLDQRPAACDQCCPEVEGFALLAARLTARSIDRGGGMPGG